MSVTCWQKKDCTALKGLRLEAVIEEFVDRLNKYPASGMTAEEKSNLFVYRRLISIEVDRLEADLESFNRTELEGRFLLELSLGKLTDLEAKIKTFIKSENKISVHCNTLNQKYDEYHKVAKLFESTKATLLNIACACASNALPLSEKNAIRTRLANVLNEGKMLDDTYLNSLGSRFKPKEGSLNYEKNKKEHDEVTEPMKKSRIRISDNLKLIKTAKDLALKKIGEEMNKIDTDIINLQIKSSLYRRVDSQDGSHTDPKEVILIERETDEERQNRLEAKKAYKEKNRRKYQDLMERREILQDVEPQQNDPPKFQHDVTIGGRVDDRGVPIRYPIFLLTTDDLEKSKKTEGEASVFCTMKQNPQIRSGKNNGFINDCGVIKFKVGTKDHRVIGTSFTAVMTPEIKQWLGDQAKGVETGSKIRFYKMSRIIDHKDYANAKRGIKSLLGQ